MTRQYWTGHKRYDGIKTANHVIALMIKRSFEQPEIRMEEHVPYATWKMWLKLNPIRKPRNK